MPLYEEILKAAAEEAAAAATDAHGAGYEPAAEIAYDFICGVWEDTDEPAAAYLPTEMPAEFEAAYEAALGRALTA
jgi:hypothetical protein